MYWVYNSGFFNLFPPKKLSLLNIIVVLMIRAGDCGGRRSRGIQARSSSDVEVKEPDQLKELKTAHTKSFFSPNPEIEQEVLLVPPPSKSATSKN